MRSPSASAISGLEKPTVAGPLGSLGPVPPAQSPTSTVSAAGDGWLERPEVVKMDPLAPTCPASARARAPGGDRGRGWARPFVAADLAAVLATCRDAGAR